MNVGDLIEMFKQRSDYKRPVDNLTMIEIAPYCFLNENAHSEGLHLALPKTRVADGMVRNAVLGFSLTPWRKWAHQFDNIWYVPWKPTAI